MNQRGRLPERFLEVTLGAVPLVRTGSTFDKYGKTNLYAAIGTVIFGK